jgi:hypothetical protein
VLPSFIEGSPTIAASLPDFWNLGRSRHRELRLDRGGESWLHGPVRFVLAAAIFRFAVCCALAAAVSAPAAVQAKTRAGPPSSLRARDQQRRRQWAAELRRQGLDVDWRLASWAELRGWTVRAAEARALREHFGVVVDWRTCALNDMRDWQGRIARATDLRRLGIDADWRLFSVRQLDNLRGFLEHERASVPHGAPTAYELAPAPETARFDPDAILLPTYVIEGLANADADDGVLEASFSLPRRELRREDQVPPSRGKPTPSASPATLAKPAGPASVGQKNKKAGKPHRTFRRRADI